MKPVVAINEPCHESWEKMNPQEQGRQCDQCCKVVVDFTNMSNGEIASYLKGRSAEKVCGRFKEQQVIDLPKKNFKFGFNLQRFAAAIFLAFGSFLFASCGITKPDSHEVMGDVAYVPDSVSMVNGNNSGMGTGSSDTTAFVVPEKNEEIIMGKVACVPDTTIHKDPEQYIMGGITYEPDFGPENVQPEVPQPDTTLNPPNEPERVIMGTVVYVPDEIEQPKKEK